MLSLGDYPILVSVANDNNPNPDTMTIETFSSTTFFTLANAEKIADENNADGAGDPDAWIYVVVGESKDLNAPLFSVEIYDEEEEFVGTL